jgi:hypothetical protein
MIIVCITIVFLLSVTSFPKSLSLEEGVINSLNFILIIILFIIFSILLYNTGYKDGAIDHNIGRIEVKRIDKIRNIEWEVKSVK